MSRNTLCMACRRPFSQPSTESCSNAHTNDANPVGRPPKLFTCNTCGRVLGSAAVRAHKCVRRQLSAE